MNTLHWYGSLSIDTNLRSILLCTIHTHISSIPNNNQRKGDGNMGKVGGSVIERGQRKQRDRQSDTILCQ